MWALAWASFSVAALVAVASSPPPRSPAPPRTRATALRVGPWRLARRDLAVGTVVAVTGVIVVGPVFAVGLGTLLLLGRWWSGRRRIAAEEAARAEVVPELIELIAIALRSGASPTAAIERVAALTADLPARPVHNAAAQVRSGLPATQAWAALRELPGSAGRSIADLLTAADRTGAPVAEAMADLAEAARAERRRRFETRVQRLPVLLLAPLVLCVLPSFLLLVCVPIVVSGLSDVL